MSPTISAMNFTFDSDVELVEQDFVISVNFDNPPNDPDYDRQWALPHIQAETAWSEMDELTDITVAVIDTGVCMSHEDLVGRVLDNGYDFVEDDNDPEDIFGHGCSVAGHHRRQHRQRHRHRRFRAQQFDPAGARAGTERQRVNGGCRRRYCLRRR